MIINNNDNNRYFLQSYLPRNLACTILGEDSQETYQNNILTYIQAQSGSHLYIGQVSYIQQSFTHMLSSHTNSHKQHTIFIQHVREQIVPVACSAAPSFLQLYLGTAYSPHLIGMLNPLCLSTPAISTAICFYFLRYTACAFSTFLYLICCSSMDSTYSISIQFFILLRILLILSSVQFGYR